MSLLIKDHKEQKDGAPIPSRPVLSGNNCLNTHLSELVSELIEPISTRLSSAEVTSTEEALNKISALNDMIRNDNGWWEKEKNNVLSLIGQEENSLTNLLEDLRNKSDTSIDTLQSVLITPDKTVECSAGNALDQSKTDEFDGDDGSEPVRSREKLHSQKKLIDFWNVTNT